MIILLAEGVPLFRRGIRVALEHTGEHQVLESNDCAELRELALTYHPDVLVLDSGLTTVDPLKITWTLRQQVPAIGILVLAASQDEEQLFQFFRHGANAYEFRSITPEALVECVHRVARGEFLIAGEVLPARPPARIALALKTHRQGGSGLATQEEPVSTFPLSAREVEILDYIARGNSNKEIAKSLTISDQTVKNHITSILKKLSVHDRTAAVVYALRHHWIGLEPSASAVI